MNEHAIHEVRRTTPEQRRCSPLLEKLRGALGKRQKATDEQQKLLSYCSDELTLLQSAEAMERPEPGPAVGGAGRSSRDAPLRRGRS